MKKQLKIRKMTKKEKLVIKLLRELKTLKKEWKKIENKQNPIDPKTGKTFDMENHENTWIEDLSCSSYTEGRLSMIDDIREIIKTI